MPVWADHDAAAVTRNAAFQLHQAIVDSTSAMTDSLSRLLLELPNSYCSITSTVRTTVMARRLQLAMRLWA